MTNDKLKYYWEIISTIHNITKELYIISEEYSDELSSFIQPIKELKDAYEHIVRANSNMYSNEADENYIITNMEKAIGHEYRAFFDTSDFLCIILRGKINDILKNYTYQQIISVWSDYKDVRNKILQITEKIISVRLKKDIGTSQKMYELVKEYESIVKELINYYKVIDKDVYIALENKYTC